MRKNHAKEVSAILAAGAEYWVAGEITARFGLIVSMAPRNNVNYDLIVNNYAMTRGCRIEVKHSRSGFKANVSGHEYDFLVFVYAPSNVTKSGITPTGPRTVYVFPRDVVETTDSGKTGKNFNPRHVEGFRKYRNKYQLIANYMNGVDANTEFDESDFPRIVASRGDERYLVATDTEYGFVASIEDGQRWPEQLIGSILKFGYWEEFDHDPGLLKQILTYPNPGIESLMAKWAKEDPQPFES